MKRFAPFFAALAPLLFASPSAAAPPLPNVDAYHAASPSLAPPMPGVLPPAFVSGKDERRGVPTFLWAIHGAAAPLSPTALASLTPEQAARAHLAAHAPRYGLTVAALSTAVVTRVLDVGRGGVIVVLRQRVGGVDLFHADVKVLMDRSLALVAIGGNLHAGAVPAPKTRGFALGDRRTRWRARSAICSASR